MIRRPSGNGVAIPDAWKRDVVEKLATQGPDAGSNDSLPIRIAKAFPATIGSRYQPKAVRIAACKLLVIA